MRKLLKKHFNLFISTIALINLVLPHPVSPIINTGIRVLA